MANAISGGSLVMEETAPDYHSLSGGDAGDSSFCKEFPGGEAYPTGIGDFPAKVLKFVSNLAMAMTILCSLMVYMNWDI